MNKEMVLVEDYIQEVSAWIPYPPRLKNKLLDNLRSDVLEVMKDTGENRPEIAFGDPYQVAKSISKGQDWGTTRADYRIRSWAFLIDQLIIYVAVVFGLVLWILIVLIPPLETGFDLVIIVFSGFFIVVPYGLFWLYGYFVIFEKLFSATPGKRLLDLSVYDESGVRITWNQAIIRNITKIEAILLLVEVLFSRRKDMNYQRILDSTAGTIVVRSS